MSTLSSLPMRPKVSMVQPPSPVESNKRMREVSIQSGIQSEIEADDNQSLQKEDAPQVMVVAPVDLSLPMSRKQRRRQLRSVSKQSTTQQVATQQDLQPRIASSHSKRTTSATVAEADTLKHHYGPAEYSNDAAVLSMQDVEPKACKPLRFESPRRVHTEEQIARPLETPTPRLLRTTSSQPSPLPMAMSYAAALSGTKDPQSSDGSSDLVIVEYKGEEKAIVDSESIIQFDRDGQEEGDLPAAAQDFKRKKRIRVRKRKNRQSTFDSTAFSKEDGVDRVDSATTFADAYNNHPTEQERVRQYSLAISNTDILVEEEQASQEEDSTSSNTESIRPKKRVRRNKIKENVESVTPERLVLEREQIFKPAEAAEEEQSFIEKIRKMLTYDRQRDSVIPPPTTSPIPVKYLSPPKFSTYSTVPEFFWEPQHAVSEAGPQICPLMPRSWLEARTWDMSPPVHGTKKIFDNPIQRQKEEERCSEPSKALTTQPYGPPLPPSLGTPFCTLWAVSRYLEQKQKMIAEHRKREGLRWAVMKAVEKNLDFQKRREDPTWPLNWNVPVVKDRVYMQKMVRMVRFLMKEGE
ncbi:hypothetical protein BKA65DRAFT_509204 [Rhexocercosporidium sp. MPI-PUGE-AT-0058]|nr:hypothetical protein BKA65DRAFT_509204 [Rhexocercosporidium sp. MPI-PUGE-AT-0058]